MPPFLVRLRTVASHATEPLLGGLVLNVLYGFDLAGRLPLWIVNVLLLVCAVYQQPRVQRWLTGGDPYRYLWPRLGFHLALYTAVLLVVGWGPLSGLAFMGTLSIHLRWSGSAAWPPAAVLGTLATVAGQLTIAAGWMFSYLPEAQGNAIAAILTVTALLISRLLGLTVAQREDAERRLRWSGERFQALIAHSTDVIVVTNEHGRITYLSPAAELITGYPPAALVGTDFYDLVHPEDKASAESIRDIVTGGTSREWRTEIRLRHADGNWRWHEANVRNLVTHPAVTGIVINHRDVTERRQHQERLLYDASHDALTGLANRGTFWRQLNETLNRSDGAERRVAVLYVDLNGFKQTNDTLGHDVGDVLLTAFAALLRRCAPGADLVARLGGDEFAVLLTGVRAETDAAVIAERIVTASTEPFLISGTAVNGSASVGVAISGPQRMAAGVLLRQADLAMYHAKRNKPGGWQLYLDGETEASSFQPATRP